MLPPPLHFTCEIVVPLILLLLHYTKLMKTNVTRFSIPSTHIWTFLTRPRPPTIYATRRQAICFIFVYISAVKLFGLKGFFPSMSLKWNGLKYKNYLWFFLILFHHVIVTSVVFVGYTALNNRIIIIKEKKIRAHKNNKIVFVKRTSWPR